MNNIVTTSDDSLGISKLKAFLQTKFQTKDIKAFRYFLGIKIA